jgi:molecular chaperone GrpE (heat shock protein)
MIISNLQEEKKALLEMRSHESNAKNPEIEELKNQLQDAEKKLTIERTKLQQKEKEIETLKKKMEEDRDSLEKIAD